VYSYFVYGLGIHSDLLLLGLQVTKEVAVDVVLRRGSLDYLREQVMSGENLGCFQPQVNVQHNPQLRSYFHNNVDRTAFLYFEGIGSFLIRDGLDIIIDPVSSNLDQRQLSFVILKSILPELIHQRGQLILHANAVEVFGGAVAFMGKSGAGKSTIAAALCKQRHSLVSDDVVVIDFMGIRSPILFSGLTQLLLWPEAATALGYNPETWPQPYPQSEKRSLCIAGGFSQEPLPLKRIYVLAENTSYKIECLQPQEAFDALVHSVYSFNIGSKDTRITSSIFRQCISLADSVSICRLERPRSFSALPDLVKLVEEDLAQTTKTQIRH
jgi:hypothetical protein